MAELVSDIQMDEMLKDKEFLRLVSVQSAADFVGFSVYDGVYNYRNNDDGDLVGVRICITPTQGNNFGENYGGHAEVYRMFHNPNVFSVSYEESVPYLSNDEGESTHIGSFAKLNNAMIAALITHEKRGHDIGDIDKEVLDRKKQIFIRKKQALEMNMNI
jgi:hypothetical protein